jgi:hypothetical protein
VDWARVVEEGNETGSRVGIVEFAWATTRPVM